mgnify:CR=1 FL=1
MKILGIGVDIIKNQRINDAIKNTKFKHRVYSTRELKQSSLLKSKTNFFSKRFAAKEAFVKALGEGFRNNINFHDIDVSNDKKGKPIINISNNVKYFLKKKFKLNKFKIFLSLSDEKKHSIAYVIINKL